MPRDAFAAPPGVVTRRICAESGELAGANCKETLEEVFIQGTEPGMQCRVHSQERGSHRVFAPQRS